MFFILLVRDLIPKRLESEWIGHSDLSELFVCIYGFIDLSDS